MSELEFQRIITIFWILCYVAAVTPADWRLLMPIIALLLEARSIIRSTQDR